MLTDLRDQTGRREDRSPRSSPRRRWFRVRRTSTACRSVRRLQVFRPLQPAPLAFIHTLKLHPPWPIAMASSLRRPGCGEKRKARSTLRGIARINAPARWTLTVRRLCCHFTVDLPHSPRSARTGATPPAMRRSCAPQAPKLLARANGSAPTSCSQVTHRRGRSSK